jgi:CheY-like chemotaxis protein
MGPKKILLVDDSATIVMMERTLLQRVPYDVITAGDGEAGVEKAVAERPDLILMDLVMPKVDGLEATRRLRANPETREIPILLLTTVNEVEKAKQAIEAGCHAFLTKPFVPSALLTRVREILGD